MATQINTRTLITMMALVLISGISLSQTETENDGQVRHLDDGTFEAWDVDAAEWVSPDTFWDRYAARRGGPTWGRRSDYPPYDDVKEFDTMIIELDSGTCLMEFFHTRWRRANDVRRWDDAFDYYSACPHVFD